LEMVVRVGGGILALNGRLRGSGAGGRVKIRPVSFEQKIVNASGPCGTPGGGDGIESGNSAMPCGSQKNGDAMVFGSKDC